MSQAGRRGQGRTGIKRRRARYVQVLGLHPRQVSGRFQKWWADGASTPKPQSCPFPLLQHMLNLEKSVNFDHCCFHLRPYHHLFVQINTPPLWSCQTTPKRAHMVQDVAPRVLHQMRLCSSTVPCFKSVALACSQAECYF